MKGRKLEDAIQKWLDGELGEDEIRLLKQQLVEDAHARETYYAYIALQQALTVRLLEREPVRDLQLTTQWRTRRDRKRKWQILAAAACIALVAQLFLFGSIMRSGKPVAVKLSPYSLSSVGSANGQPRDGVLKPGDHFTLEQGNAELNFSDGTKAVVQGPAELTLVKRDELKLDRGVIWCLIGNKSKGFRVVTPELEAIDLGTDFGVVSDPDAPDEAHVFSGTVEVVNRRLSDDKVSLRGGEARRIGPDGKLVSIPSRPEFFSRELPDYLPVIRFNFDPDPAGNLTVTGDHPEVSGISARLVPEDAPPQVVEGPLGPALGFAGGKDHVQTNWPGIAGNAPRTVTFLMKTSPSADLRHLCAILGWGNPKIINGNGKWKVMLVQHHPGGRVYPRISLGWQAYDGEQALNDGKWHHCAITYTGRLKDDGHPDVCLYVDGVKQVLKSRNFSRPEAGKSREPETDTRSSAQPLTIGYMRENEASRSFEGEIGDVRIYAGVLPEDEIRKQADTTK